jgi:hypothetical protein
LVFNIQGLVKPDNYVVSSNGAKLGKIVRVLRNIIVMEFKKGEMKFFLPSNLIKKITESKVYLKRTERNFLKWLDKNRSELEEEYLIIMGKGFGDHAKYNEMIRKKTEKAFKANFKSKSTKRSRRVEGIRTGRFYIVIKKNKLGEEPFGSTLIQNQISLRTNLPYTLNLLLPSKEWIYEPVIKIQTEFQNFNWLVQTSNRIILFTPAGGEKYNWDLPLRQIKQIHIKDTNRLIKKSRYTSRFDYSDISLRLIYGRLSRKRRILEIKYSLSNYENIKHLAQNINQKYKIIIKDDFENLLE